MRSELERVDIPGEHEARERTWSVVRAAFAAREPERPRRRWRPLAAVALAGAVAAGLVSPPGRAVLDEIREAVGVRDAEPALFSLPTRGRLLVASDAGVWVVQRDGSRRLLGRYREASWSPYGRFVVAAAANELAALEPDGDVRWKLSRPGVRLPRWGGTRTDTAIAYLSGTTLRVVAGDGTGDVAVARNVSAVAPAWRPGSRDVLAYVGVEGRVHVLDVTTRRVVRRARDRLARPRMLAWSRSGRTLVALSELSLHTVLGRPGHLRLEGTGIAVAAAPRGERFAVVERLRSSRSRASIVGARTREVFAGTGAFTSVAWSPDGRWLLLGWRDADQVVFVRLTGARRIRAAAGVSQGFESGRFPRVEGWCCSG